MLTQDRLKEALDYNEVSGDLIWKIDKGTAKAGDIVGANSKQLYNAVFLDGNRYLVHRLIWFFVYGEWPKIIDHRDGNPRNNVLSNLRDVSVSQNAFNKQKSKSNTCGYKNVSLKKDRNKYAVNLEVNGKSVHIGHYADLEEANQAAIQARNKYHGEYAKHD